MPRCENDMCGRTDVEPDNLRNVNGQIVCEICAPKIVGICSAQKDLVWGRQFDYELSYTKVHGLRAGASIGGAKISFEVSQEELGSLFGPER